MRAVTCMAPSSLKNTGYMFAHLHACELRSVWLSVRPAERSWHWVTADDPSNNVNIVELPNQPTRYISRTLYQGYYLPGWWREDKKKSFRAVDPVTQRITKCSIGEFLAFSGLSSYWWIPYTPGDVMPKCALPLSQLPTGSPLYIVKFGVRSENVSGFYNHLANTTYVVKSDVYHPTAVDILCGTWIIDFKQ